MYVCADVLIYMYIYIYTYQEEQLQHPREVFYSDEFDVNYVNTIECRTIVVHSQTLPPGVCVCVRERARVRV